MTYLALDLSKRSTGFALWSPGWEKPVFGRWVLGGEYSTDGQVFAKLHRSMADLHAVEPYEFVFYEEPINPGQLQGHTTIQTINLAVGLAAHVLSFVHAKKGCRIAKAVNVETWRKDFIGDMVVRELKAGVRRARKAGNSKASARNDLKKLTMERCRQLGLDPANFDEADAIGILTYALLLNGRQPPWLAEEVLRPMLAAGGN